MRERYTEHEHCTRKATRDWALKDEIEDITDQTVLLYMFRDRIITEFSIESIKLIFFLLRGSTGVIYVYTLCGGGGGRLLLITMPDK